MSLVYLHPCGLTSKVVLLHYGLEQPHLLQLLFEFEWKLGIVLMYHFKHIQDILADFSFQFYVFIEQVAYSQELLNKQLQPIFLEEQLRGLS